MLAGLSIGFATPAILWALAALPVLWWLLRAVPPAPVRRRFAGIALLLGLREREPEAQRTPWWLLALRMGALAALIVALAGPVLNPQRAGQGDGPLLIVMDGGWASARDWPRRIERVEQALEQAQRQGRVVGLVQLTEPPVEVSFGTGEALRERLPGLAPQPWDPLADITWVAGLPDGVQTLWLSDGAARAGRDTVLDALQARGTVAVFQPATPLVALTAPILSDAQIRVPAQRLPGPAAQYDVIAVGLDPAGVERDLGRAPLAFDADQLLAEALFDLPPELRNRVTRFRLDGVRGAAAVALGDDSLRRRKIALLTVREGTEGLALLSPLHYLREALVETAEVIESASLNDLLLTGPDVIVLADQPSMTETETAELTAWMERGGLLLRFAGPRLAGAGANAALGVSAVAEDPLLPVPLRAGGRTVGGAMSWGNPRGLAPFPENSPFYGLPVPADVGVQAQVLAQPGPDLAARTLAALEDGTPLVTRAARGNGQVVLFHVTANAEWSSLPLSGLFVSMLERLAVTARLSVQEPADLAGTRWQPDQVLDGFGALRDATDRVAVTGEALGPVLTGAARPGAALPPGLYAGPAIRLAVNTVGAGMALEPAVWPASVPVETGGAVAETPLAGYFLAGAVMALVADVAGTLALGGLLLRASVVVMALGVAPQARAQDAGALRALEATAFLTLAHVPSGDAQVDETAHAGLRGLAAALFRRTSVEPGEPMLVDLETDDIALFPLLYWPVLAESPVPSAAAYERLNRYLRSGGMIVFDTRDAEITRLSGGQSSAGRRLQVIARGLDIPPLEPVPADHVLTRSFYLLADFPGRHQGGTTWVEAAPVDAEQAEGMPFRTLNDGVTPIVLGANDWAAAWAVDDSGMPLLPVGRGSTGERQRELALRFGVNLVMHVLSGNYKSDQVHVPALLERLGQ